MANVVPANDAQTFLDSLATSQLLSAEALAKVRQKYEAASDPKAVARDLLKEGVLTKWQATQLLNKYTAMIVGNYKLLDQLGVGEMGRVFLAEHVQMQRKVALKVLARKHTSQPNVLRRLLAEARRVAAIEHPNISHIHDVNQDGDRYFIVLEYIDGDDLQKTVQREGKLAPAKAWHYIRQTAEGLAHAHAKGVLHGGLKPSNLLVDKSGNVKILDFGLAQLASGFEGTNGDSVDQAAVMAKLYRAPETEKQPCTQLADVYSLGAALYYLLTGKDPVEGPASAQKLTQLAPDVAHNLVDLCDQLMSADPTARPQNDKELIAAIDAARPTNKPAAPAPKATPAPTKTTSIKTAKALPDSPAVPAAKEPPPKAKKPVMAKALPMPSAGPIEAAPVAAAPVPEVTASEAPAEAPESDAPFAGFAIQTKKTKSPAAKNSSGAMPAIGAAAPAPAVDAAQPALAKESKAAKGKAAKTNMPLIIAGGVGGGVLVLTGIIALIMFLMSGKGDKEIAKADPNKTNASAGENTAESNGESNPAAAPAESNPVIPPESNPVVPVQPAEANPKPVVPIQPMPEVKPEPAKPEPMPVQPEVKPEVKPEPPMVAAVAPKPPEPKPTPKPSAPIGDPFVGFAKSVALPKVVSGVTEAPAEMLVPVVLGPCKVPDENTIISSLLKGGETAYSKGKMKFTLEPANGGTSTRDWEFKVTGGLTDKPAIIATMSAKNDQLTFQWTPEAVKQPASAYLCNCIVELKAGNGKTEFALRQPVSVDPIVIGFEKRPPAPTYNIDLPPEGKQLMFEIVSIGGEVPKSKIDKPLLVADKDNTFIRFGNVETEMPLLVKLDTSFTSGRTVKVTLMPHFQLEGMPRAAMYAKKELNQLRSNIDSEMGIANAMIQQASVEKNAQLKQKLNQDGTAKLEPAQKANAQFEQMLNLAKGLQSTGKMHFRIFASAEDGKVELVNSQGAAAAPAPAQPGPAAKAAPNPPANADSPLPKAAPRQPMREGAGPKAPAARAPIGTIEVGAEELAQELAGMDAAEFSKKYEGKSFRITGAADTLYPDRMLLTTGVTKNGDEIKMVMVFAKKGETNGIAKGTKLVIDGDYEGGSPQGPMFGKCELVSK
jgi:serine/threonine protein kinase